MYSFGCMRRGGQFRSTGLLGGLALVALIASSCSSGSNNSSLSGPYPTSASPCSYVSTKQVSQIAGQPVTSREVSVLYPRGATNCVYTVGPPGTGGTSPNAVTVSYYTQSQLAYVDETPSSYITKRTKGIQGVQRVPNLGDAAYSLNGGSTYIVSVGGGILSVIATGTGFDTAATAQQVAKTATQKVQSEQ